jgi:glycerophosphoryl diester phosphodiesterase
MKLDPWPYPRLIAHRGGGALAPENTLAAFRLGQELGYGAHEFDVKLAKDGVAMLLHDDTLERTTTGKGRAADFTWEELARLDAGAWHSDAHRGEPLAALEDVARLLQAKGTLAHIEIKPTTGFERATGERVARLAARLWKDAPVPPLLSSFSFEALMAAKEAAPGIPRGWLASRIGPEDWKRAEALAAVSVHTDHRKLDPASVARAHDAGYRILAYTVNDAGVAEGLFRAGLDGLFTDNLREFALRFPEAIRAPA